VVEDLNAVCTIVAATEAWAAAPPVAIEPWLRSGEIVAVPFKAPWLFTHYGFIRLASRSVSPAAEVFMGLVRAAERELEQHNQALVEEIFGAAAPAS